MYQIGLDIGATNTRIVIADNGEVIRSKVIPTLCSRTVQEIVDDDAASICGLLKDASIKLADVEAIGVGVPGAVDKSTGTVLHAYNLQWFNVPLAQELKKKIDKPVFLENDANCAALAEHVKGVFQGKRNAFLLTLSTGLGSSMILNGRMYSGRKGTGVEMGHVTICEGGITCTCGNKGCLEAYCSASALEREGRRAVIDQPYGLLYSVVKGDFKAVNAKHVLDCAKKGDAISLDIVNRFVDTLGSAIASIINLLDPEIVGIGGSVSKSGEFLLAPVRENVKKKVFFKNMATATIEAAKFGSEGGAVGASFLAQYRDVIDG